MALKSDSANLGVVLCSCNLNRTDTWQKVKTRPFSSTLLSQKGGFWHWRAGWPCCSRDHRGGSARLEARTFVAVLLPEGALVFPLLCSWKNYPFSSQHCFWNDLAEYIRILGVGIGLGLNWRPKSPHAGEWVCPGRGWECLYLVICGKLPCYNVFSCSSCWSVWSQVRIYTALQGSWSSAACRQMDMQVAECSFSTVSQWTWVQTELLWDSCLVVIFAAPSHLLLCVQNHSAQELLFPHWSQEWFVVISNPGNSWELWSTAWVVVWK